MCSKYEKKHDQREDQQLKQRRDTLNTEDRSTCRFQLLPCKQQPTSYNKTPFTPFPTTSPQTTGRSKINQEIINDYTFFYPRKKGT